MSKSLQDQLLSLGLAQKKSATKRRGKAPARSQQKSQRPANQSPHTQKAGRSEATDSMEMDLARAYALRKKEEKQQAETARRQKQEEDRRRRQLNKEIGVIVKAHRLNDANAELSRNFMYKGRIRKIHLTAEQLRSVNQGELGVVYMSGGYHLLAREQLDAVRALSAEHVPDLTGTSDQDGEHPVPDDLIW